MRRYDLLSALGLFVLLCAACTGTPMVDSPAMTAGEFGRSACMECLDQACSAEITACGQDPSCAVYLGCIQHCPVSSAGDADVSCEAECSRNIPLLSSTARATRDAFLRCRNQDAGTTCAACGKVSTQLGSGQPLLNQQCSLSTESNSCYRCEAERCCQSNAKYRANPSAVKLFECYMGCSKASSETLCDADCRKCYPDGVLDLSAHLLCKTARCGSECNNGKPLDACTACSLNSCIDALIACESDADCNSLNLCLQTCLGVGLGYASTCPQSCLDLLNPIARARAQQQLLSYQLCTAHFCEAECGTASL